MSGSEARCASCRRFVVPQTRAVGPSCPNCGGIITGVSKTQATPVSPPAAVEEEVQRGPIAEAVADEVFAQYAACCGSVAEMAALRQRADLLVVEAYNDDAQRMRELEERRQRSQAWRAFAAATMGDR